MSTADQVRWYRCRAVLLPVLTLLAGLVTACAGEPPIPLKVELGTRSISKLPFVIAADQGLYAKYGLDVELKLPPPDRAIGGRVVGTDLWTRASVGLGFRERFKYDILVDGLTPYMVNVTTHAPDPHLIALAATDCVVRMRIVGRKGLTSVEQLKGGKLGVSSGTHTTTGFAALLLAEKMGWDPVADISIMRNGRDVSALRRGLVDAIVASETRSVVAIEEGFPLLLDTKEWNESVGGNSVLVEKGWLEQGRNREAARRFLKAALEGIAIFHQQPDVALDVMARWYGLTDRESAAAMHARGQWTPRDALPCYQGIQRTIEVYDSNGMRKYQPTDFYDDSLIRELNDSGFVAALYDSPPGRP